MDFTTELLKLSYIRTADYYVSRQRRSRNLRLIKLCINRVCPYHASHLCLRYPHSCFRKKAWGCRQEATGAGQISA
jgi:hypothetical protein